MAATSSAIQPFPREAELVAHTLSLLPELLAARTRPWRISIEVPVGRIIPDIVVIVALRDDTPFASSALSARESVLLTVLRQHRRMARTRLEAAAGLAPGELTDGELARLEKLGLVRRSRNSVVLVLDYAAAFRIIAIEAKLDDWRAGIAQAERYGAFADESYVALPAAIAASLDASSFIARGVGLFSIGDAIEEVVPPQPRPTAPHGWRREYVASRVPLPEYDPLPEPDVGY